MISTLESKFMGKVLQKCKSLKMFESSTGNNAPSISVSVFTLGTYARKRREEKNYKNVTLMEELI